VKGHERYAPCTLDELRFKRYDYWALGHIHAREVLCEDPLIVFAGNVQGRHARETGPKGCLVSTIHSDHSVDQVFHRLDQVRWERGHVDVSGLEAEADALDRTGHLLDELIASECTHESLLAVRVVLRGRTALHGRLFSDPDRLTALVRNVATQRGGDRIWIEKVELQLEPPGEEAMIDGPIEELLEVVEQLRHDRTSLESVLLELGELKRRLPSELIHDPEGPRLSDAEWLQSLLGHVQPFLLDLLVKSQAGSSNGGA
jgi:DNA repair exonuclease SbcCD nuclease subunit